MNPPGSEGERQLQKQHGTEARAAAFYDRQMLDHLNPRMRAFIAEMEMMFVATADAKGECDCTLRAGLPGFVRVLDDRTLTWPEYRGNGVMASLGNMAENPHVGLWFGDFFGSTVGLHVNGKARIAENEAVKRGLEPSLQAPDPLSLAQAAAPSSRSGADRNDSAPAESGFPFELSDEVREAIQRDLEAKQGRAPERWVVVEVQEAYIHCSKHVPRLQKLDKPLHWGTDDERHKGGDFFGVGKS